MKPYRVISLQGDPGLTLVPYSVLPFAELEEAEAEAAALVRGYRQIGYRLTKVRRRLQWRGRNPHRHIRIEIHETTGSSGRHSRPL